MERKADSGHRKQTLRILYGNVDGKNSRCHSYEAGGLGRACAAVAGIFLDRFELARKAGRAQRSPIELYYLRM